MLKTQKLTSKLPHFVTRLSIHGMIRAGLVLASVGLVVVATVPHHNVSSKQPTSKHHTVVKTAEKHAAKHTTAAATPVSQPQVAVTTPAPAPAPAPKVVAPAPKVVVPAPNSNVSGLKPTSTPSSGSSSSTGSSSSSSSGSSSSSSGSSSQPPVGYESTNWSGYMSASGTFTSVTGAWVVPTVSGNGTSTSADGTWIGIGGVTTGDLIQAGTQDIVTASGMVSTTAFYEMLPQASITIPGVSVAPGDSVSTTITELSAGSWKISFSDLSDNETFSLTVSYASSESSAEWIEEDPSYANGSLVPFATFGSVSFSGGATTVGGSSFTIAGANSSPITLVTSSGKAIAVPSKLTADGGGFTVTQQ